MITSTHFDTTFLIERRVIPPILTPGEARLCALEPGQRPALEVKISASVFKLARAFEHARRKRQRRVSHG